MNVLPRNNLDPGQIAGIIQAYKKAVRLAQSFSNNRTAEQLTQSLVYSQYTVQEAYNEGRTRCGIAQLEAISNDSSIVQELQAVKLTLLELAETLRDYIEDADDFHEPPFPTLTKTSDDIRNKVLAILEKLIRGLPQTLPVSQKRQNVPPTPPPKDDDYMSGGSGSQRSSDGPKELEREPDPSRAIKSAAQFALPSIDSITRSASSKGARRMAYISDPKSATSRSSSPMADRGESKNMNIWDQKSEVENGEGAQHWIPAEEIDHQILINEEWLHQRKLSRIAFRASSITSEYTAYSSPLASPRSLATSPRLPPPKSPLFLEESSSTAATSVNSEDFSRYSLGKLNPPNIVYDHNENKIVFLDSAKTAERKPLFNRRGASEDNFHFGASLKRAGEREFEDDKSPRTISLPLFEHNIEDGIQLVNPDTSFPGQVYEDGLMLANEFESENTTAISLKSTDDKTLVIAPSASFYQFGGFCPGALMLQNAQPGAFKMCKKPSGNYNAAVSGKCTKCAYEVSWQAIERDNLNDPNGIVTHTSGIRWRQRFLQKSHLSVKNIDEALYACVFCIEEGQTLEAYDATVFFSVQQLFRHLEKHLDLPRKEVKIDVLSGTEGTDGYEFDIHFLDQGRRRPPGDSDSTVKKLEGLASGIASATHRPRNSNFKSRDPDGAPTLQFAKGACILGITFPPRFSGTWASGYHDGTKAHFPISLVVLTPPTTEDVLMSPKSSITAMARWDFKPPKDSKNWLSFSRKEKISNIGYAYEDFWCWSGQNSKGKWGLFPKVFVEGVGSYGEVVDLPLGGLVPLGQMHSRNYSRSGGVLGWVAGHKYSSSTG